MTTMTTSQAIHRGLNPDTTAVRVRAARRADEIATIAERLGPGDGREYLWLHAARLYNLAGHDGAARTCRRRAAAV
jgi:hypothetical protein